MATTITPRMTLTVCAATADDSRGVFNDRQKTDQTEGSAR